MSTDYKELNFFDSLAEIITDSIYIGEIEADLQQELATNTWLISCSKEDANHLVMGDFKQFFEEVIDNRREQIHLAGRNHSMWFYLWHDKMASQLRFSLISDFHNRLPFGATVNVVPSMDSIIQGFLEDTYHDGIAWEEMEIENYDPALHEDIFEDQKEYILDVYVLNL